MALSLNFRAKLRALHHSIINQSVPEISGLEIPVLYLDEPDGSGGTRLEPLLALSDYFIAKSAMSKTWMRHHSRVLGLLFDYLRQRQAYFDDLAQNADADVHGIVLTQFENHLLRGTVTIRSTGSTDETNLFWLPMSADNVVNLMTCLRNFVIWREASRDAPVATLTVRALLPETGRETLRFLYAAKRRKGASFLAHLNSVRQQRQPVGHAIVGQDDRGAEHVRDSVQFPREFLVPLLLDGFVVKRPGLDGISTEDTTAKLLTLLCACGGLRKSEPFHLWVRDIQLVGTDPVVFLHHPARAVVELPNSVKMTRHAYLEQYHGMTARNLAGKPLHAGWKGIKCNTDHWAPLYWLPFGWVTELFWATFTHYLFNVRPPLMAARARRGLPDHPFLLVSSGSSNHGGDDGSAGNPYSTVGFFGAWNRAMNRLRKLYDNDPRLIVNKALGTSPHGLRHLYGGLLAEMGISPVMIQQCMHHRSPLSQQTYTKPRNAFVTQQLDAAMARHETGQLLQSRSGLDGLRSIYAVNPPEH